MPATIISEGTINRRDTIPKLLTELSERDPTAYQQAQSPGCGFAMVPSYALEDSDSEWWASEDADGIFAILIDALDLAAPAEHFFGTHPDDPACLGFFPLAILD